ncbi:MAG: hypothetical protein ABR927_04485 [Bacteroidales bacterium]|jgi:hypothetical protein
MQNKLIIVIFISLFSFAYAANGQKDINTPYSRFNLGTLETEGSFRSLGMGGVGTAIRDNSSIFFTNPASYSSLDTLSFIFDFGLDYGSNIISNSETKFASNDMDFHHLIIGFPLAKRWGFAAGVVPVSSGYYQISQTVTSTDPGYDPNTGEYTANHDGSGGINKFFIGSGLQIGKNFSIGANMSFLSGQITRSNSFLFSDFTNVFNNNSQEKLVLNGINFDYGIQYTASFKNNYFLNIGASITSGNNFSTKYSQLSFRYTAYSVSDTISYVANSSTKTYIPATYRFGISFGKKNKFTTGFDYTTTKWSASIIPGSTGYAADTREFRFGAEYIPDKFSNYSYISRIEYRIGAHFGDNYLIINQQQLKEYGGSIGLGLPMFNFSNVRNFSKMNLFIDFTRITGPAASTLPHQDCFTVGVSLNLYDNWFLKKMYD